MNDGSKVKVHTESGRPYINVDVKRLNEVTYLLKNLQVEFAHPEKSTTEANGQFETKSIALILPEENQNAMIAKINECLNSFE